MPWRTEVRLATEVYVSTKGYVCIRQEAGAENDPIITLEPEQVPLLIRWLQEALPEARESFGRPTGPEPTDAGQA
jgi:hypothetical protein